MRNILMKGTWIKLKPLTDINIGLQPMMKCPPEKTTGYFIITLIVAAVVAAVLSMVLAAAVIGRYGAASFLR